MLSLHPQITWGWIKLTETMMEAACSAGHALAVCRGGFLTARGIRAAMVQLSLLVHRHHLPQP